MPPAVDAAEHVKFLVTCIKYAKDGKVDFQAVADDIGIVSKAAAGKRYERLLKSYEGIGEKTPTKDKDKDKNLATPSKTPKKTPSSNRKRAAPNDAAGESGTPTKKPRAKAASKKNLTPAKVKDGSNDDSADSNSEFDMRLKKPRAKRGNLNKKEDLHDDEDDDDDGGDDGAHVKATNNKATITDTEPSDSETSESKAKANAKTKAEVDDKEKVKAECHAGDKADSSVKREDRHTEVENGCY